MEIIYSSKKQILFSMISKWNWKTYDNMASDNSYPKWVSKVLQVQLPKASFASGNTGATTLSCTVHRCDRWRQPFCDTQIWIILLIGK